MNQAGEFCLFAMIGKKDKFARCCICYEHSKLTVGPIAALRLEDNGELSIIEARHHPNCTPLSEREIAFHYHYSTTENEPVLIEADEPANKRPQIEHDQELLPNYD